MGKFWDTDSLWNEFGNQNLMGNLESSFLGNDSIRREILQFSENQKQDIKNGVENFTCFPECEWSF